MIISNEVETLLNSVDSCLPQNDQYTMLVRVVVVTCILEVVQSQSSLPRIHRQGPRSQMDAPLGCMKASLSHVRSQHTVSHSHNVRVTISLAYILCDLCKHTYRTYRVCFCLEL